jgi:hypothetical protein
MNPMATLAWEKKYPYILGILPTGAYYLFLRNQPFPTNLPNVFNGVLTVSAIAIGFFATAKAIIVSVEDSRVLIRALKQANMYDDFLGYVTSTINWSFVLAGLTAVYLVFDFATHETWKVVIFGIWIFVATTSGFLYFRAIRVLSSTLDRHQVGDDAAHRS